MQRWIAIGVVLAALLLGGGVFAVNAYRDGRPHPVWMPIPIRPDVKKADRDRICDDFTAFLTGEQQMLAVVKDLQLARRWELGSEEAAMEELKRRTFVRQGSFGDQTSINIGLFGKRKERELTEEIVKRIMKDLQEAMDQSKGEKGEG